MDCYREIERLLPIIYPQFSTAVDMTGNELVFLKPTAISSDCINIVDKTECEAFENHVHLFDKISKSHRDVAKNICSQLATNLWNTLKRTYPDKLFVVYLVWDPEHSVTIRFHQKWPNEKPYYDINAGGWCDGEVYCFGD